MPEEVLFATHQGAALTLKRILDMGESLKQYMDGYIYISFNKIHEDTTLAKSSRGGSYVQKANYVLVKSRGHLQLPSKELSSEITAKIKSYVPAW